MPVKSNLRLEAADTREVEMTIYRLIALLTAIIFMICLASCSDSQEDIPDTIRIGYLRVPNDETIAKADGIFDEYFTDQGINCEFIIFDSGVDANKALLSGSIDFATMGHTNGVIALATGIEVELIWIHEVLGDAEQLVARENSGINSIKDLAGRKVATVFASTAHYSLLHALREAGIEKDVTLLDMQTADIVAAWERGDIDAAYTWQPSLEELLSEGKSLVSSRELAEKGAVTANILLARTEFTGKHPDLTADFISALAEGGDVYRNNGHQAAEIAGAELELPADVVIDQMAGSRWLTREEEISSRFMGSSASPGEFARVMYETAVFLADQEAIATIPDQGQFNEFVNPEFIELSLGK
jgi:taurine transport system substrate-binding protein